MLRQIMRKHNAWARIQGDVTMLKERQDVGHALTEAEERTLLAECSQSRSRILYPFVALSLQSGARRDTIRTLAWKNVDLLNRCLKFGKDKTRAGTGRAVPLNPRAMEVLTFWAQQFPDRRPEHYVFPAERVGAAGTAFDAKTYHTDVTRPVKSIKSAWEAAKHRTQRHCPSCQDGILADRQKPNKGYECIECHAETQKLPDGLTAVRFHDLRHTAASRMIADGVPLPIVAKVLGWSVGTMTKMAARYGHFGMDELRAAVEAISRRTEERIEPGYPQKSRRSEAKAASSRAT